MAQYIDKSAIMAEIKRYKHKADERLKIKGRTLAEDLKDLALQNLCGNLIHTLDTLEVKEIDFDFGSPDGDIGVKTIWDGDKVVSVSEPSNNLEEAAKKAGQKYFPDKDNIWARPNYEAKAAEDAFKDGVNWQKKQMIDKACEFLKSYRQDTPDGIGYIAGIVDDKTIEDFKKAMQK